jgi:hypothetical protein
MNQEQRKKEWQINNFRRLYKHTQGGIFTKKTREKILTKEGISGRNQTKNTFWYRQREAVKTSLIDLLLFLEEAGESNVEQVITEESLRSLVKALLKHHYGDKPSVRKAEIARSFIISGFNYLSTQHSSDLTVSHKNTIHEAVDLADYLAESLKPREKRQYPTYRSF